VFFYNYLGIENILEHKVVTFIGNNYFPPLRVLLLTISLLSFSTPSYGSEGTLAQGVAEWDERLVHLDEDLENIEKNSEKYKQESEENWKKIENKSKKRVKRMSYALLSSFLLGGLMGVALSEKLLEKKLPSFLKIREAKEMEEEKNKNLITESVDQMGGNSFHSVANSIPSKTLDSVSIGRKKRSLSIKGRVLWDMNFFILGGCLFTLPCFYFC
jgi:glycosylphosphatidylinositol transamidase (GPIT) subunit GPI8